MAIHAHSTAAPARPLLPLRGPDGRFARRAAARPELPPEPLLAAVVEGESTAPAACAANDLWDDPSPQGTTPSPLTADEVLDDIARELDRQNAPRGPLRPAEEIGLSASAIGGLPTDAAAEEITPAPLPPLGSALSRCRGIFGAVTLAAPVVVMMTTTRRCHDGNEGMVMMTTPVCVTHTADPMAMMGTPPVCITQTTDPAFAAVRAFDRVVAEWDCAFADYLGIKDALDPRGLLCWDDPPAVARAVLGPVAGSTVAALDRLSRRMEALDARHEAAEARLLSTRAASEIGAAALRACVRRYARRPFGWRGDEAIMLGRLAA